jgi:hypothetical protein
MHAPRVRIRRPVVSGCDIDTKSRIPDDEGEYKVRIRKDRR